MGVEGIMIDLLKHTDWVHMIPFMLTTTGGETKLNTMRLVESVIIGAIVAGLTVWATQKVIENEIAHIQSDIKVLSTEVHQIKQDFYKPVVK